nr:acetyl-CoA carboxylase carboxyltransferase beta subunit [Carex gibba]YP_010290486.1 acetyl-CoA carboxylase carboxyltransferase beta subunit [Carex gibba]ULQ64323.1 acetyl-CoA carboxylase carboxyltransferase beta subunit [Carex gibba]ULQ64340.1 acetyl-CoA carboxylase carboxyltransferase beta subunit [Carex gibba]
MDIQKLWSNIKQILINTPYFFAKKGHMTNKISFITEESNKMKQDKFKKMITSGEQMEEKRKNIEKELLEEELDLDQEELDKMNEDKLDSDEEELNKLIGKKYTRNEIEQLFLLAEIETKAEIEEKEKNLAYDEDANQNSKKSEESTEYEESHESEEPTESEESQESSESTEYEESQESSESTKYEESSESTEYEESQESSESTKYEESSESTESEESQESSESTESEEDIPYMDKVDSYQRKTGLTDAVQTGIGQLDGIPVALAVMDFEFIGGSMGSVVGEKITRLIQYATRKSLPLIICCASGGARMQEGSFSLMQMGKISSTLLNFQFHENLFLVSLLTSPTTGGVTASFGMLGDIIIGEPDATIAFAGKRVIEEVMKIEVPEGVQEAEYLLEKGSLDSIVPRNLFKGVLSELLAFHGIKSNRGGV